MPRIHWEKFAEEAPRVSEVFIRRHSATGKLCLLATLRSEGYPRISPMEPRILDGKLILVGMPNTRKFRDLGRDPRFCLHTATVDAYVGDGDAKLWGNVVNLQDKDSTSGSQAIFSAKAAPTSEGRCSIRSMSAT